MSTFAFLPRSIGRQKTEPHKSRVSGDVTGPSAAPPGKTLASGDAAGPSTAPPGKTLVPVSDQLGKATALKDEELLSSLSLSLSDYALWCAPDLHYRMKLGQEGYIPMKYLLNNCPLLTSKELTVRITEVDLMRCLRSSTASNLEARMLISEPSRGEWRNRSHAHDSPGANTFHAGGFEVRRKDWESVLGDLESTRWTKEWWSQRTVYMERLPATLRSIPAVSLYVWSLLTEEVEGVPSQPPKNFVQSVVFPPHHSASPTEPSRCKGFVFVVLDSPQLVSKLAQDYPWEGSPSRPHLDQAAVKFGLRALPNASWNILKEEYISYQQRLLSEAAEEAAALELPAMQSQSHTPPDQLEGTPPSEGGSPSSWYPQHCLVFVRNIHPGTNKTTLRALFQGILSPSEGGVDYVDFNKGIDLCHLRVSSPSAAMRLIAHFESSSIAQSDALDQNGSAPGEGQPEIMLEAVQGKREELYWEKVPEKLRSAAMERLAGLRLGEKAGAERADVKRKRRRRNS